MKVIFKERLDDQRTFAVNSVLAEKAGATSSISFVDGFICLRGEPCYDLSVEFHEISTAEFERIRNWVIKFDLFG